MPDSDRKIPELEEKIRKLQHSITMIGRYQFITRVICGTLLFAIPWMLLTRGTDPIAVLVFMVLMVAYLFFVWKALRA